MDIVLLHGFTETPAMWSKIQQDLTQVGHRVLTPAHLGNIETPYSTLTMEDMANWIFQQTKQADFHAFVVVGHSMGGYVAQQMLRQNPKGIIGLGLMQSTAAADGEEKKRNRTQLAGILRDKGSSSFLNTFLPSLFAEFNRAQSKPTIAELGQLASLIPAAGLAAQTEAMRDRLDGVELLQKSEIPLLFLPGRNDTLIKVEDLIKQAAGCKGPFQLDILENSGHMGIFEEYERTLAALHNFIDFVLFHQ